MEIPEHLVYQRAFVGPLLQGQEAGLEAFHQAVGLGLEDGQGFFVHHAPTSRDMTERSLA